MYFKTELQTVLTKQLFLALFNYICAGLSVELPMGDSTFGIDYSYRDSQVFQGTHSIGVRIDL